MDSIFGNDLIKYLTNFIIKYNLVDDIKLYELRKLNKQWKLIIEQENAEVVRMIKYHNNIRKKLHYDRDVYDNNYYKRIIIRNQFSQLYEEYKKITIPCMNIDYMIMDLDIDSDENIEEKVYVEEYIYMPYSYDIFIYEYSLNPSPYIEIFPVEYIKKNIFSHIVKLKKYMDIDYSNVIFLIPICYSKHFKAHIKDKQYVSILCFINVIDKTLNFPDYYERYIVLIIDLDNLENTAINYVTIQNYMENITDTIANNDNENKITDYYYADDIVTKCETFDTCLNTLFENQRTYF